MASEKEISRIKGQLAEHESKRYKYSHSFYKDVLSAPMAEACKKIINKLQQGGKFPAELSENLIHRIFEIEECICGRPVKVGSDEFKELESWLSKAHTAKFTADVLALEGISDNAISNTKLFIDATEDHEQIKAQLESSLATQQKNYDEADNALKGIKEDNIDHLNKQRDKLTKERNTANNEIDNINNDILGYERILAPKEKEQAEELQKSKVDPGLKNQFEFLKVAESRLKTTLESYEKIAKTFVKERINEYFAKYATKSFKVEFNDEFLPSLHEKNIGGVYTAAPESSGENLLKNIAFVCTLMEFSSQRTNEKATSFQIEGVKSPFVIDAPFGDSDGRYSRALAEILAACNAEQIIIFLSKKHYKGSFEDITEKEKLVGRRYIIDNYATNKEKEELDIQDDNEFIEIGGKKYKQIHDNKDFGYSKLRKI